jgi:ATP-dependent Clp protease, protease subunit
MIIEQHGAVEAESVAEMLSTIHKEIEKQQGAPLQITLWLNSYGGDPVQTFYFVDRIEVLGVELEVIVSGQCGSAAVLLLLAASKRTMSNNSYIALHNIEVHEHAPRVWTVASLQEALVELKLVQDRYVAFLAKRTGQSEQFIRRLMESRQILTPEEAQDLGFVHHVGLDKVV